MASSPTEPTDFALREIAACWNQAYEALARGDVDRASALMAIAGDHVGAAGDGRDDAPATASLRREALAAFGRLRHGLEAGLAGVGEELAKSRQGAKALRGYGSAAASPGSGWSREG